ncbi:hypothetical protein POM88_025889 [Heracleum sosnowskyi]|uniref:PB1-like domain-containing protein n=1 Tax=Heracleum sosnowskyi TaxID=360622 RepID=A0AAD8I5U4_9APIA|nr:hypothetical protein POM88_025889 [Heracleum sosnowskyi]
MNSIRVEIQHGGEFNTKEGIYYYKGGTIDNIYNVDISALSIDRCLNFLRDIGYGNGLKLYYKKPLTNEKVDDVVEEMNFESDGSEPDDRDYEEEQYSDSGESCDEDSTGDDVESDSDEEVEAIRERK